MCEELIMKREQRAQLNSVGLMYEGKRVVDKMADNYTSLAES